MKAEEPQTLPDHSSAHGRPETSRCDLGGRGVLVTRPADQAQDLCRLVAEAGGRPIRFPTIAIAPTSNPVAAQALLARSFDLLLFVSRNAVTAALPLFPAGRLPAGPSLAAIGAATTAALTAAGRAPDLAPGDRFDSESLLALPELADLRGKSVLIVRGSGGRDLLGETLGGRGAEVAYAEVYRRVLPQADPAALLARWDQDVQLATATSGEVLANLVTLVGAKGRERLLATPLVVVSERTAAWARGLGFARVACADRASDAAVLAALCRLIGSFPGA